jgi:hypothetical protein
MEVAPADRSLQANQPERNLLERRFHSMKYNTSVFNTFEIGSPNDPQHGIALCLTHSKVVTWNSALSTWLDLEGGAHLTCKMQSLADKNELRERIKKLSPRSKIRRTERCSSCLYFRSPKCSFKSFDAVRASDTACSDFYPLKSRLQSRRKPIDAVEVLLY